MVSEMMLEDVADLAERGINLSPCEVVRLNALGLKAERGPSAFSMFTMPRACMLGDISFREPTLGHEMWLDEVSRIYEIDDGFLSFAITAFCYSVADAADLPSFADAVEVRDAVERFIREKLYRYTIREIAAAVRYVRDGVDQTEGEVGPERKTEEDDPVDMSDFSTALGVIREGQSIGLGIQLADALKMTRPALRHVIQRAYLVKGVDLEKGVREDAMGDYNVVLDEIVSRHEKESGNG